MQYIIITHTLDKGVDTVVGPFDCPEDAYESMEGLGLDEGELLPMQSYDEYWDEGVCSVEEES